MIPVRVVILFPDSGEIGRRPRKDIIAHSSLEFRYYFHFYDYIMIKTREGKYSSL